jgi:PHAX RNA-binding domain
MIEPTTTAYPDWHSWGTTDDDGHFVTLGEQAAQRKEQAVTLVVTSLGETEARVRNLIKDIVRVIGTTVTLAVYEETLEVEQNGGLMLPDGSRRRTPGGVFFTLVKTRYPETSRFFQQYSHKPKKAKGPAQTPKKKKEPKVVERKPKLPPGEKGTSVKITLVGRPSSRIVDKDTFFVFVMQVTNTPPLPKGLPTPPAAGTNFVVRVATKQWKPVADSLSDPEDALIIEGFPQVDAKNGTIAVFAQNITTKKLQAAKRKPAQEVIDK